MNRIYFVAHPVGGDVSGNIARVLRWYRWLPTKYPDIVFSLPWLAEVMVYDDGDPAQRSASIDRNRAILGRLDGIVLVGGRISTGMKIELDAALARRLEVLDLTHLGEEPPAP